MDKNRLVLEHCPHFYTIINFEYYSNDIISEHLIDVYEKYIFSIDLEDKEAVGKIEKLDTVLYKYINDFCFRDQVQADIRRIKVRRGDNILDTIVTAIIRIFNDYEISKTRRIQITRWI